jgi:hypothetical protein
MTPSPMIREKSRKIKKSRKEARPRVTSEATRSYTSNSQRGLGPEGGGWNIAQAAHWSGFSEAYLRDLIKRHEAGEIADIFPYYRCGRRLLLPRRAFKNWFDGHSEGSSA